MSITHGSKNIHTSAKQCRIAFQSDYAASSNTVLINILILSTIRPLNFCQIRSKMISDYTSNLPFHISDEVKHPSYIYMLCIYDIYHIYNIHMFIQHFYI